MLSDRVASAALSTVLPRRLGPRPAPQEVKRPPCFSCAEIILRLIRNRMVETEPGTTQVPKIKESILP